MINLIINKIVEQRKSELIINNKIINHLRTF